MSIEEVNKFDVMRLLRDGEELIVVDFDRMIIRNVYSVTAPLLESRIASKNVFFFRRVDE